MKFTIENLPVGKYDVFAVEMLQYITELIFLFIAMSNKSFQTYLNILEMKTIFLLKWQMKFISYTGWELKRSNSFSSWLECYLIFMKYLNNLKGQKNSVFLQYQLFFFFFKSRQIYVIVRLSVAILSIQWVIFLEISPSFSVKELAYHGDYSRPSAATWHAFSFSYYCFPSIWYSKILKFFHLTFLFMK